jgi:hypothetical protein
VLRTPLIICIDVEPDERAIHPRDREDWDGFEKTWAYVRKIRAPLQKAMGAPVHFSWFLRMDPQIARAYGSAAWVMTRYGHLIQELQAAGDEVGLHPHLWRWDEERETWIVDFGSQEWVARCIRQSFAAFEQCFGRACRSVRLGGGWMNDATMGLVEKLGARFDLTVEPRRTPDAPAEPFTGSLPDYERAPREPYRPAKRDFQTPGGWWRRKLWEIPLSTGRPAWAAAVIEEKTRSAAPRRDGAGEGAASIYEGWHDRADHELIEGWVYDVTRPDAIVAVDIFENRTLIATLRADCFRPDLLGAGKGHGRHAFAFPVPDRLKEYVPLNLAFNSSVFRGMFDAILTRHRSQHLALVLRSDAGRDPVQRANLEQGLEHILGHAEASRFMIATPAEAIGLLHS